MYILMGDVRFVIDHEPFYDACGHQIPVPVESLDDFETRFTVGREYVVAYDKLLKRWVRVHKNGRIDLD